MRAAWIQRLAQSTLWAFAFRCYLFERPPPAAWALVLLPAWLALCSQDRRAGRGGPRRRVWHAFTALSVAGLAAFCFEEAGFVLRLAAILTHLVWIALCLAGWADDAVRDWAQVDALRVRRRRKYHPLVGRAPPGLRT